MEKRTMILADVADANALHIEANATKASPFGARRLMVRFDSEV
jgi:hypothetical protein